MNKGGLIEEVRAFVSNLGYRPLDLREVRFKSDRIIRFALYRPESVSVGDCARVTLAVRDFIYMIDESEDIRVEVSSPGAERVFKKMEDYEVFSSRKVQLTLKTGKVYKLWYLGLDEAGSAKFSENPPSDEKNIMTFSMDEIGRCRLILD